MAGYLLERPHIIQITVGFSLKVVQKSRKWNIFKTPKENNCQLRILYTVKISFRNEGELKTFLDEGKLTEFITKRLI